jgi:dTDP-4-amino-4,6-dideoxygalactose transaminase
MRDEFLTFGSPQILPEDIAEVLDSLQKCWLGTGPKVKRFEEDFAHYKGVSQAVAVHSCTAALHLAMLAEEIGPGDEVITTSMTFCASVNAILHAGAKPVLADCDRRSLNLDPDDVLRKITPKTKAILPVHFAGRMCDMDRLMIIAEQHKLKIIEDCAHAVESTYQGRPAGTIGDCGCFSFYATKNLACGEGGMVLARRDQLLARIKTLALHGMTKDAWQRFSDKGYRHYQVVECGFKYNMMDLQAAIGIHQLRRVESNWPKRKKIWDSYNSAFADLPVTVPAPLEAGNRHGLHLYTLLLDLDHLRISRDEFLALMTDSRIGVGVHYLPIHTHPFYAKRLGLNPNALPNALWVGERTISLPLSPAMTSTDIEDVVTTVRRILKEHCR